MRVLIIVAFSLVLFFLANLNIVAVSVDFWGKEQRLDVKGPSYYLMSQT